MRRMDMMDIYWSGTAATHQYDQETFELTMYRDTAGDLREELRSVLDAISEPERNAPRLLCILSHLDSFQRSLKEECE